MTIAPIVCYYAACLRLKSHAGLALQLR